ncbi:MAG: hypothetical protein ACOYT4_02025 [Nanoarchaeota archaeon]
MAELYLFYVKTSNPNRPSCEYLSSLEGVIYCDSVTGNIDCIGLSKETLIKSIPIVKIKSNEYIEDNLPFWYIFKSKDPQQTSKFLESNKNIKEIYLFSKFTVIVRGEFENYKQLSQFQNQLFIMNTK